MVRVVEARPQRVQGMLERPAGNARATWTERRALLLRLVDEHGRTGIGEAAPLPGYSTETLDDCEADLRNLKTEALAIETTDCLAHLGAIGARVNAPAARFALETAWLDLLGQHCRRPIHALLSPTQPAPQPIPLSALIDAQTTSESLELARNAFAAGVRTFKLKVGRPGAFEHELELARALVRELGPSLRLRLDANGVWPLAEARERLTALAEIAPEFLEEPTRFEDWRQLAPSPIPLALDETLQRGDGAERLRVLAGEALCHAIVLKPMALGGFTHCLELARLAGSLGVHVSISHLFDGPVALAAASELALSLPTPPLACGLRPHAGLSAWPPVTIPQIGVHSIVPSTLSGLGISVDREF